jgi:hypothetical protein
MRRLAILLVTVMLVGSIGIALALASNETSGPTANPSLPLPSFSPGSLGGPTGEAPGAPESFAFGAAGTPDPAGTGAQSRLWFNAGSWWGVFLTSSSADQRIFRLDAASLTWIDTGAVVDDRPFAKIDAHWDGERLLIASAGEQADERHALRVDRFSYDPATGEYRRNANFPVPVTAMGVAGATLARAGDGRLWVAYRDGDRLLLDHSLDSDLAWHGPIALDVATGQVDAVAMAAVGDRLGLVWTVTTEDALHVAWLDPSLGTDGWSAARPVPVPGLQFGEDEIGIAVDRSPGAERLFVGLRTSADRTADRQRLAPQVVVAELGPEAEPVTYLVGRVEDQHGGPSLVVDGEARLLHVVMAAPSSGGTVYRKTASLDSLEFSGGVGQALIPATEALPELGSPSTTKQSVDAGTGLVVAATDPTVDRWGFGSLGVAPVAAQPPDGPNDRDQLVNYTFNGLAVGVDPPGWEVDGDPLPPFTVVSLTGFDSSARLTATTGDARACARFAAGETGVLRAGMDVLFNEPSAGDIKLIQVRGRGGEAASIRLREGEVVYADGDTRVRSDVILEAGRWYRAVLGLDLATRTYGIEIRDVVDDAVLLAEADLGWAGEVEAVDRICAELSPQPGLELYLDEVRVRSRLGEDEG